MIDILKHCHFFNTFKHAQELQHIPYFGAHTKVLENGAWNTQRKCIEQHKGELVGIEDHGFQMIGWGIHLAALYMKVSLHMLLLMFLRSLDDLDISKFDYFF